MKGIAKKFKIGDLESLFYFYLCFVFLSEIFVVFWFKKNSFVLNSPFAFSDCFFVLLIVPLVETFLLGFITEAFNYIFIKNERFKRNNFFALFVKKTKLPFVLLLLLFIIVIYALLNMDEIVDYSFRTNKLLLNSCIILFSTFLTGIFILFVLKLFLFYKLKQKTMNYQFEIEKQQLTI